MCVIAVIYYGSEGQTHSCWICCLTACAGLADAEPPRREDIFMMDVGVMLRLTVCMVIHNIFDGDWEMVTFGLLEIALDLGCFNCECFESSCTEFAVFAPMQQLNWAIAERTRDTRRAP